MHHSDLVEIFSPLLHILVHEYVRFVCVCRGEEYPLRIGPDSEIQKWAIFLVLEF